MESNNVRKLFLVDQFDRVYKQLQRPIQAVAKTESSINLSRTLQDEHLTEDEKVKRHIDELHRYLHVQDAGQFSDRQPAAVKPRFKRRPSTNLPPPALTPQTSLRKLHSSSSSSSSTALPPRKDADAGDDDDDDDSEVFFAAKPPIREKKKARQRRLVALPAAAEKEINYTPTTLRPVYRSALLPCGT